MMEKKTKLAYELDAENEYMKAKNALFETMVNIIMDLAINKVFKERTAYSKYLCNYNLYMEKKKKFIDKCLI